MNIEERLKQITEHFKNLSPEEFENNLIKSGVQEIKVSSMKIITKDELEKEMSYTYSLSDGFLKGMSRTPELTSYSFFENEVA